MAWHFLMKEEDLWEGEMKGVVLDSYKICIMRVKDHIYAYEDRCAHLGFPLSKGSLTGNELVCCAHQWVFDCQTGKGINPSNVSLKRFETKIEEHKIYLKVDD